MKLLALNASHRGERGITARLLARLGEGAQQAGAGFETLTLARQPRSHPRAVLGAAQTPAVGAAARGAGAERPIFLGVNE
jgi:multimeric flavodoxin WrbA